MNAKYGQPSNDDTCGVLPIHLQDDKSCTFGGFLGNGFRPEVATDDCMEIPPRCLCGNQVILAQIDFEL